MLAVEEDPIVVDQDREAGVLFVAPTGGAFRADRLLVSVSWVADGDPEVRENFARRHIAGLKPGGLPRSVSHLTWLSTQVRQAASQSANMLPFAP